MLSSSETLYANIRHVTKLICLHAELSLVADLSTCSVSPLDHRRLEKLIYDEKFQPHSSIQIAEKVYFSSQTTINVSVKNEIHRGAVQSVCVMCRMNVQHISCKESIALVRQHGNVCDSNHTEVQISLQLTSSTLLLLRLCDTE